VLRLAKEVEGFKSLAGYLHAAEQVTSMAKQNDCVTLHYTIYYSSGCTIGMGFDISLFRFAGR